MTGLRLMPLRRLGRAATMTMGCLMLLAACAPSPDGASGDAPPDEHAEAGQDEDVVTLGEAAFRTAGIRVEAVRPLHASDAGISLEVPGEVQYDPRRVTMLAPRAAARLEQVLVVEGDQVAAGDTVAILTAPALAGAQDDFRLALRRVERLRGSPDESGAVALVAAARRRLLQLGVAAGEVARLEAGGAPAEHLVLVAPFAGSILAAHAMAGVTLDAGAPVFTLADASVVDVVAEIPEVSLPLVSIGQAASIAIAAYPGLRFDGHVERMHGELSAETRTAHAVIHTANGARHLKAGMFAVVRLAVPMAAMRGAATDTLLTVPQDAVVSEGERRFVFVETGERRYRRREVTVGSLSPVGATVPSGDRVLIRNGLAPDERVVVQGAFILKSELAKAALGEHGH